MESNEPTELTRKMGTDSYMERRMTGSRGGGIEQKAKGIHVHRQQYSYCWGIVTER